MGDTYELTGSLSDLIDEVWQTLKEKYASAILADSSVFAGRDSYCRVGTYQVYSINQKGYVTINVYFFRQNIAEEKIQVKVSAFSPLWSDDRGRAQKVKGEIGALLLSRGAVGIGRE